MCFPAFMLFSDLVLSWWLWGSFALKKAWELTTTQALLAIFHSSSSFHYYYSFFCLSNVTRFVKNRKKGKSTFFNWNWEGARNSIWLPGFAAIVVQSLLFADLFATSTTARWTSLTGFEIFGELFETGWKHKLSCVAWMNFLNSLLALHSNGITFFFLFVVVVVLQFRICLRPQIALYVCVCVCAFSSLFMPFSS